MSLKIKHTYKDATYYTDMDVTEGLYYVIFNGGAVTGTHSKFRGEASMRFMIFLDEMLDQESKRMNEGDVLVFRDKHGVLTEVIIESLCTPRYVEGTTEEDIANGEPTTISCIGYRHNVDGENFLGPSSAYAENQVPGISLSGGPFGTRVKLDAGMYEWQGTRPVTFWAWKDTAKADGGFDYTKEVNVWLEKSDIEPVKPLGLAVPDAPTA